MCGRYTLIRLAQFTDMFPWIRGPGNPGPSRYNIAPSQDVAVITNDGKSQLDYFRWGLVPFWAKDPAVGNRLINARAETLPEKPAFREALRRRRCLIPADGFFEWKPATHTHPKTPMYFRMRDQRPFAFAGLWETWKSRDDDTVLHSCVIITGQPNDLVQPIHDRMPVIIPPERYRDWINPDPLTDAQATAQLKTFASEPMEAYPVSTAVNRPSEEGPHVTAPVEPDLIITAQPTLFG